MLQLADMLELAPAESIVCSYVVDADDIVLAVDQGFHDFARDNGAPSLSRGVVGSLVWRFIADAPSRHLYQLLFTHARETGRTVRVPHRCDSPNVLREMAIEIIPGPRRSLQIVSRSVRAEAREPIELLDPMVPRSGDLIRLCSWCKALLVDDAWIPLEEALVTTTLRDRASVPPVSHSACPDCTTRVMHTIGAA